MADSAAEIREAALRLLSRREHSRRELARKLARRGWAADVIEEVLDRLADSGLQSDQRYAESFARTRAAKYYGPMRIRAELGERGIDRALAERAIRELDVDWFAQAADFYQRRYGDEPAGDIRERSRRSQALSRRGFAHELVRELID